MLTVADKEGVKGGELVLVNFDLKQLRVAKFVSENYLTRNQIEMLITSYVLNQKSMRKKLYQDYRPAEAYLTSYLTKIRSMRIF